MSKKKIKKEKNIEKLKVEKFTINFIGGSANSEDKEAKELYEQSRFGESKEGKILYSLVEVLYLLEKERVDVLEEKKKLDVKEFTKKAIKHEPNLLVRYVVFKDMRNRGYIVKTALKFGADFRVYDRGVKPGEDHAKWILYPVKETEVLTWYEFSAKNRVAHSTRKRLLVAVVDEENDCTFYEIKWTRP
ncbi:MAG: tRNA-intron lyase [Nanoarchaeota archaeon]|nr:tRNA-intron lyase [Nanoarchaeota archaeon]